MLLISFNYNLGQSFVGEDQREDVASLNYGLNINQSSEINQTDEKGERGTDGGSNKRINRGTISARLCFQISL